MTSYELWDQRTANAIGRWPLRRQALTCVRNLLDRGEIVTVAALVLRRSDWGATSITIAAGSELVALARAIGPTGWPDQDESLSPEQETAIENQESTGRSANELSAKPLDASGGAGPQ